MKRRIIWIVAVGVTACVLSLFAEGPLTVFLAKDEYSRTEKLLDATRELCTKQSIARGRAEAHVAVLMDEIRHVAGDSRLALP